MAGLKKKPNPWYKDARLVGWMIATVIATAAITIYGWRNEVYAYRQGYSDGACREYIPSSSKTCYVDSNTKIMIVEEK